MNEGLQCFPAVMARMYNLAMQLELELLHLWSGKHKRTQDRRGYAAAGARRNFSRMRWKIA